MVRLEALVVLMLLDPCQARAACPTTRPIRDVHGTYECPGDFGSDGLLVTVEPEIEFRRGGAGYVLSDGSYGLESRVVPEGESKAIDQRQKTGWSCASAALANQRGQRPTGVRADLRHFPHRRLLGNYRTCG